MFQRQELLTAAALLAVHLVPFIGQIIPRRREQKGTEPTPRAIRRAEQTFFQEPREKALSKILRVVLAVPTPPDEIVKRLPVLSAEAIQRRHGLPSCGCSRARYYAPMS